MIIQGHRLRPHHYGESMPFMVGYFVSLLVTKVLVGLPTIFLRIGALSKMCLRRMLSSPSKLTQRELDEMYSPENVLVSFVVELEHIYFCLFIIIVNILSFFLF